MTLRQIANSDYLCKLCNENKNTDNYGELLKWTKNIQTDSKSKFDPYNYIYGYRDSMGLFLVNDMIDEDLVCMTYIYYGFNHGLLRNKCGLKKDEGKILLHLPSPSCVYIEARDGKILRIINDTNQDQIRLQLTLKYMYDERKYPKNENYFIDLSDGPTIEMTNPLGYDIVVYGKPKSTNYEMIPDPYFINEKGYKSKKKDSKRWIDKKSIAYWRGSSTGAIITHKNWENVPRIKMCLESLGSEMVDAKISKWCQVNDNTLLSFLKKLDISAEHVNFEKFYNYKFLINIDGNNCAWNSMFLKLQSNSVVLHIESQFEQWYYHKLKPWVHYVPITNSIIDIEEKVKWCLKNEHHCLTIIKNANALMNSISYDHPF
jgi:hypothetical protein